MLKTTNPELRKLIEHYMDTELDDIVDHSRLNCGAIGLHRIGLLHQAKNNVDLFCTSDNHTLWRNFPYRSRELSITTPFATRKYDITLRIIKGNIWNMIITDAKKPLVGGEIELAGYIFEKQNSHEITKRVLPKRTFSMSSIVLLREGQHWNVAAGDLQNIAIERGVSAIWLVQTGRIDGDYNPVFFTNAGFGDPSVENDDLQLNIKPTKDEVCAILKGILNEI